MGNEIVKAEVVDTSARVIDDENHVTRQEATRMAVVAAGIDWPGTILPPGTALYQSGVDKLRADRARWARLPDAKTAVPLISAALEAEDRKDYAMSVPMLRLREDNGRVASLARYREPDAQGMGYSAHSFRQLIQQIPDLKAGVAPRGLTGSLLFLTDEERARIVNARIDKAESNITLRTKMSHNGQRLIRASLSEKYGDVNDIHVSNAISAALNSRGSTCKLDYKPGDSRSQFEIIFPSELPIKTFRVGDVHYAGILVRNSETGEGSVEVMSFLFRAACANLTLSYGKGIVQRIIHVGDSENLRNKVRAAIVAAELQLMPLVAAIQKTATTQLPDVSPGDIIEKLARSLQVGTDRARDWKDTFEQRYLPQAGNTVWALQAAITESAQRAENWVASAREEAVAARITAENGIAWVSSKNAKDFEF